MALTTFIDWLSNNNFGQDDTQCEDYENLNKDITHLIMSKYSQEFSNFLEELAEKNNDEELDQLLQRLGTEKPSFRPRLDYTMDKNQIVQPMSDRGIDPNAVD